MCSILQFFVVIYVSVRFSKVRAHLSLELHLTHPLWKIMGRIFSRPVGGPTRAHISSEDVGAREGSPSPPSQPDVSFEESNRFRHDLNTRQGLMIENTRSSRAATSQAEISPSATNSSGQETIATTAVEIGGSFNRAMGIPGVVSQYFCHMPREYSLILSTSSLALVRPCPRELH